MPLKLDVKRKLSARSDRVKSVDLHPTEPWMVAALYNGNVHVWNHESQQLIKTFEVCELPVRAAKFVPRKHWILTGSDDMLVRAYNYNTLERVHQFEAHADYLRCIAIHPTQPFFLTCADDMLIKLWEWEKWSCVQVFEGHSHYVMQIVFNPKDNNQFASASLDKTVKVWQLGCAQAAFTLEGHEKGVNCIDYYTGGDKPYLISGADDRMVRVWDYQTKSCVHSLEGHVQNVTAVAFHPELPLLLTGSEDGTVRVWHAATFRLETTLNYGLERVWSLACQKGNNHMAIGYDEGSVIVKMGREEPAISMDVTGKIVWAKHAEIQQANVKTLSSTASTDSTNGDSDIRDGERLPLTVKELGSCEIYPQTVIHNSNGRFLAVVGDGEYIIYTAMALRNKSFGQAAELVWSSGESNTYAIREAGVSSSQVKICKNFKEVRAFKPELGCEAVFGGHLLGVRSLSGLSLYDWETVELVRRVEIVPRALYWNETGELLAIVTDESFFILKFNQAAVEQSRAKKAAGAPAEAGWSEDAGYELALEVQHEVHDQVKTALWIADCFTYTNALNRLNYFVGGETVIVAHLDRTMYILNYIGAENRLYLSDKELGIVSFRVLRTVLEYQTAVMRRDLTSADRILAMVPREQRTRIAHFLEKQGYLKQALAVTTDAEHRFDLALKLNDLPTAHRILNEAHAAQASNDPALAAAAGVTDIEHKWKLLADLAVKKSEFEIAADALQAAQDENALLLLASATGNRQLAQSVAERAFNEKRANTAFLAYFMLGDVENCLEILIKTERLPEAAFFARTYLPSQISRVVKLWRSNLAPVNAKAAQSLADPTEYENLFAGLKDLFKAEQFLAETERSAGPRACGDYKNVAKQWERKPVEEMKAAEEAGSWTYVPPPPPPPAAAAASASNPTDEQVSSGEPKDKRYSESSDREQQLTSRSTGASAAAGASVSSPPFKSPSGKANRSDDEADEFEDTKQSLDSGSNVDLMDFDEGPRVKEKKAGRPPPTRSGLAAATPAAATARGIGAGSGLGATLSAAPSDKRTSSPSRDRESPVPARSTPPLRLGAGVGDGGGSFTTVPKVQPPPTTALPKAPPPPTSLDEEDLELDDEADLERKLAELGVGRLSSLPIAVAAAPTFGKTQTSPPPTTSRKTPPTNEWGDDDEDEDADLLASRPAAAASSSSASASTASSSKKPPSASLLKKNDEEEQEEVDLDD